MEKFVNAMLRFARDEEGVTAVEYGLIAALIAVAVIVTVASIGVKLDDAFKRVLKCLTTPTAAGCTA